MAATRLRVARWQAADHGPIPVRITAGYWTSRAIAHGLNPSIKRLWRPQFMATQAALDIARREADIGLRNAPPEHPWLARKQLSPVQIAIYGKSGVTGYVATPPNVASQRWLHEKYGDEITAQASDPRLCLDLAEAGHGRIVLPCFVGNNIPWLHRISDEITELTHEVWLVTHQDTRHDPHIRAAIDEVTTICT